MSTADRLYELLPAIHRIRDAEQGYPLRDLLAVIARQVAAMEENLEQLYDDQFIETCAPWVAPYIGDLIGYRTLHGVAPNVASPRADVANTIRYRRRKGTAAMLEQMASDVTDWSARAVEFFQLLGWTQHMNHLRSNAHYSPDLRNHKQLSWHGTAFDTIAHTVDVRRISTGAARHNIANIGIYLWRVQEFSLIRSPAAADYAIDKTRCFRFNPLGTDMVLFNHPVAEEEISHLAEPRNVPIPLGRRWLKEHMEEYYGLDKSLAIAVGDPLQLIPIADEANKKPGIHVCDLSDIKDNSGKVIAWAHQPAVGSGNVAIDPVLGRIAFADAPASTPLVSFYYGFTSTIGGGDYERSDPPSLPDQTVQNGKALQTVFDLNDIKNGGTVEVTDNFCYKALQSITVNDASDIDTHGKSIGKTVELRAKNGFRPLLKAKNAKINLQLGNEATLIIDGWVIQGYTLIVEGNKPCHLILRDCTLVPRKNDKPCLINKNPFATVELERCITGPLHCVADTKLTLQDCIIDAGAQHLIAFRGPGTDPLMTGGVLSLKNCTVIGKVHTQELTLASNCIFTAELVAGDKWKAPLWADRRQQGCVRFSYVPPESRTPRRYHCQPEADDQHTWPGFTSLHYGDPGYCQLLPSTSNKIKRGADDEGEMGVLHGLSQPQRETNLRVRLDEYLRFGLEAGLIYEN